MPAVEAHELPADLPSPERSSESAAAPRNACARAQTLRPV